MYGHINLSSTTHKVKDTLKTADKIAVLGKAYSVKTDGERKHLHLGIHYGDAIELRGYVQTEEELVDWLNGLKYISPIK